MTGSPPKELDKGRIVGRYRQASTQDTFLGVSRKLFWVGTGPEVVSKQDSMWKCGVKVLDWPETESERPEVTREESQRWLRVVLGRDIFFGGQCKAVLVRGSQH